MLTASMYQKVIITDQRERMTEGLHEMMNINNSFILEESPQNDKRYNWQKGKLPSMFK